MQDIKNFKTSLQFLFTDIDDTLTEDGRLGPEAYSALWELSKNNVKVIPVTGRPAGWCELIARQWPVEAVVGENGGFYFRYHQKKMIRHFFYNPKQQAAHRLKLSTIEHEILANVPGCAVASDQFCRLMDLAIDFCEDVPKLPPSEVEKIVAIFKKHGAQAKVSSIHVNGWFGNYDKLTMTQELMSREYSISFEELKKVSAFVGDSPNDEPMFGAFPFSFAVANIKEFIASLKTPPQFVAKSEGGVGFAEIAAQILKFKRH